MTQMLSPGASAADGATFVRRSSAVAQAPRFWLFVAVALAGRLLTFGGPVLGNDEEFYFAAARAMANGALPFVDVWDRKPVGLFLLYLPPASLPFAWGVLAYQLIATGFVAGTAWLIARIADRAGWERGAIPAGLLYLFWLPFAGGSGGQAPVFYNLLMAGAALLLLLDDGPRRRLAAGVAMFAVGLALQIKYSVLFEGLWFGLWAMWREWRTGSGLVRTALYGTGLAALSLLPTAMVWGYYASTGEGAAFMFANFQSIGLREGLSVPKMMTRALVIAAILAVPVAMACGADRSHAAGSDRRAFLRVWLVVAILGILPLGVFLSHYSMPVLVPASIAAAAFLGRADRRKATVAVIGLALIGGQLLLVARERLLGDRIELARIADAIGQGPGCLYVYSGTTMLHPATGRCSVTSRIFPSHLMKRKEAGAVGLERFAELRRIFGERPAVVVTREAIASEDMRSRALVAAELAKGYRVKARLPLGKDRYVVWTRKDGRTAETGVVARFNTPWG